MTVSYPLLGEPLVVEFVNTDYLDASGSFDFLANPDLARGWMEEVCPDRLTAPPRVNPAEVAVLLKLRKAIRTAFDKPSGLNVDIACVINDAAVLHPTARLLDVTEEGKTRLARPPRIDGVEQLMSALADDAIALLTGHTVEAVRTCDRPACHMRYFQQHQRRRYCNPRCASADRQARYNRRQGRVG